MKTTFKLLALCGVLSTTLALSSCRDQDFDWESAKKANSEYNYAQNFSQIYGSIDPNQSWDFSYWGSKSAQETTTRAKDNGTSTLDVTSSIELKPATAETTKDPVTITNGLIRFMNEKLMGNNCELESGYQFTLQVPYCGFTIIPIFYGGPKMTNDFELHMVVLNADGKTANDYTVWKSLNQTDIKYADGTNFTKQQGNGQFDPSTWSFKGTTYGTEQNTVLTPNATMYFYVSANMGSNSTKIVSSLNLNMIAYYVGEEYLTDNNTGHEYLLVGVEVDGQGKNGGGNYSMNDFVFLIEGLPKVPSKDTFSQDWKPYSFSYSKRYMVEDMGFTKLSTTTKEDGTSNSTLSVNQALTDIDFNDIVVDLNQSVSYMRKLTINSSGIIVKEERTDYAEHNDAVVRALGGTWDFILYIDDVPVFQKSQASGTAYQTVGPSAYSGKTCPAVTFNANYSLAADQKSPYPAAGTTVSDAIDAFNAGTIYNTDQESTNRGDNHYQTEVPEGKLDVSWLCSFPINIKSETTAGWDRATNNIRFAIIDGTSTDDYFDSKNDDTAEGTSVHTVDFPQNGAYPKIVAFDVSKPWQRERKPIDLEWFSNQYNIAQSSK